MRSQQPLPLAAVILLCLALVGCSRPPGTAVSFMVFGDPAELAAYQSLVDAFSADFPQIRVELQHTPAVGEYRQRLATGFAAGTPPDVMLLNYRRVAAFARQGALDPLGPYLAASERLQAEAFFESSIDAFYLDGELWCIPQNMSSLVVYYNRDLFAAAGLPPPAADWSWDDFLTAARALTVDVNGNGRSDQYGAGIEPSLYRLAPFIWQNGGELVDDPQWPARLTLDDPAALEAFTWFVDLQVREGVVPDAVAESAESSESRFLNDRLAMYFNSRRGVPTYRTITSFSWDVAPLPRRKEAAGILHSDAYCLAAVSRNKEAAWSFIEFASSEIGQQQLAATGRTVPSLGQVARSPLFLEPHRPPLSSHVFLDALPHVRRLPTLPEWIAIEEIANREIERAFYGRVPVTEAATTARQRTQSYFDRGHRP
jgi:multiple sugar transport system substrate-binding protein